MSQEYNGTLKRSRRARTPRNRPVLVTSDENTTEEQTIQETTPVEEIEETPIAEPEPAPARGRMGNRLPNFFSTVGKSEKEDNQKESEVVQARLARATKGKASTATGKTAVVTEEAKETPRSETKAATTTRTRPAQQQGAFKTRYILGIAIYLFAANFIGTGITLVLRQMHADVVLTQFNLFGGKVIVSTSTVLFLALLIIILVLLARFDLIPRSLAPSAQNRAAASKSSETTSKQPPSPIRQGVKGEDDDLYQEYRLSQRRTKKR
jgi:hypothetical protein